MPPEWGTYPPAPEISPGLTRTEKGLLVGAALAAVGIVTWGIVRARWDQPTPKFPTPDCSEVGALGGNLAGFRYLERVTKGADPAKPLPMVVLFHSRGSRPENHSGMFQSLGTPVRMLLPEGPKALGQNRSWTTRASRTTDQDEWADELEDLGANLAQFIDAAVACRPTQGRPVVTGSSEGGHVAYLMATLYPELVSGGVAVAGYLPEPLWDPGMAPTVGLHGEEDTAVPFGRTEHYWRTMEAEGAPIAYRSFPGVGHSVPGNVASAWREALRQLVVR